MISETIESLKALQNEAAGLCAACLSGDVADNAVVLEDLLGIAENMSVIRDTSPENEELYQRAVSELTSAVMTIAVFTAELIKRPIPYAVAAGVN